MFDNFLVYSIIISLVFILLIYPGSQSLLANYISRLFNKTDGLSGRDVIYDVDRVLFLSKPIFGYGSMRDYTDLIGRSNAHSFIFQYLIDGGIIGLLLLFNCYRIVINSINNKNSLNKRCYLFFMLFVFTIRNIMEAIGLNYLFYVLGIIYFMYEMHANDYYNIEITIK